MQKNNDVTLLETDGDWEINFAWLHMDILNLHLKYVLAVFSSQEW